jgi:hypothetical protein
MLDPVSLVEGGTRHYGRLAGRPATVNPLDEYTGVRRSLRRLRLKEWLGFTLLHPDLYASLIIQDAKYLCSSEIYVHDRQAGELYQHARNAPPSAVTLPANLMDSTTLFSRPGYRIAYAFHGQHEHHTITIDIATTGGTPALRGELHLLPLGASAPLSVSSRLPKGRMYTNKVAFPVEGTLRVGEREFVFDAGRDLAILDEHKSFLPYRTTWTWGTFAAHTPGGVVGANFVDRPELPGEEEESCIWTAAGVEPLADITFDRKLPDPLSPWHIASADGRLDVTFTPEGRKSTRHQLGIFAIDYFQLYGTYDGNLRTGDTTTHLDSAHGVCERMNARL